MANVKQHTITIQNLVKHQLNT